MGRGAGVRGLCRFEALTARQQDQARARFFNARTGDGYRYELLPDGSVLCRRRAPRDPDEGDYDLGLDGRPNSERA